MRHLWSFLAGVAAAPLSWLLIALGQSGSGRTITGWIETNSFNAANLIEPAVYLAAAGILLGLLGTLRISPLGPMVAGLLLIAPYAGMFVDPFAVHDAVPGDRRLLGDSLQLRLPLENGTLLLLGALLLMATFSWQRWRRWPAPAGAAPSVGTGYDTPTINDWSPAPTGPPDADSPPYSLGYPESRPQTTSTWRPEGESPWSVPPGASTRRDGTPD
jgi:hypothetical protein